MNQQPKSRIAPPCCPCLRHVDCEECCAAFEKTSSTTSAEQVLEEQITELSEFVHENAEMVQNKLEDKWGDFDLMITSIWKELQKRGRELG